MGFFSADRPHGRLFRKANLINLEQLVNEQERDKELMPFFHKLSWMLLPPQPSWRNTGIS